MSMRCKCNYVAVYIDPKRWPKEGKSKANVCVSSRQFPDCYSGFFHSNSGYKITGGRKLLKGTNWYWLFSTLEREREPEPTSVCLGCMTVYLVFLSFWWCGLFWKGEAGCNCLAWLKKSREFQRWKSSLVGDKSCCEEDVASMGGGTYAYGCLGLYSSARSGNCLWKLCHLVWFVIFDAWFHMKLKCAEHTSSSLTDWGHESCRVLEWLILLLNFFRSSIS